MASLCNFFDKWPTDVRRQSTSPCCSQEIAYKEKRLGDARDSWYMRSGYEALLEEGIGDYYPPGEAVANGSAKDRSKVLHQVVMQHDCAGDLCRQHWLLSSFMAATLAAESLLIVSRPTRFVAVVAIVMDGCVRGSCLCPSVRVLPCRWLDGLEGFGCRNHHLLTFPTVMAPS